MYYAKTLGRDYRIAISWVFLENMTQFCLKNYSQAVYKRVGVLKILNHCKCHKTKNKKLNKSLKKILWRELILS